MFFFFPVRDEYRVKRFPFVVSFLIAMNIAVYLVFNFSPDYETVVRQYGFIPAAPSLRSAITCQFLHGGLLHLGFNMWYLWLLGDNIEDRWGPVPFLFFYLTTGIFAAFLYGSMIPDAYAGIPLIGASGSIAGVLGAYAFLFPRSRITFRYFFIFFFFLRTGACEIYASAWLIFWFLQQAFSTILVQQQLTQSSTAFAAHCAGFIFGLVVAAGVRTSGEARHRENVQSGAHALTALLGPEGALTPVDIDPGTSGTILHAIETDQKDTINRYARLYEEHPGTVLPEAIQFALARAFERCGRTDLADSAYRNFIRAYPFSRKADDALLAFGKLRMRSGDPETARRAFLQIALFYPYSDCYEEARHLLERKPPHLPQESAGNGGPQEDFP